MVTVAKLKSIKSIMQFHSNLHATLGNLGQPKECTQTEFNCITLLFHGFDLLTVNILEHSGTVHYIECCKKVEFQLGTQTDTHTDIRAC